MTGSSVIRARDGADCAELQAVAEIAISGWDHVAGLVDHG